MIHISVMMASLSVKVSGAYSRLLDFYKSLNNLDLALKHHSSDLPFSAYQKVQLQN